MTYRLVDASPADEPWLDHLRRRVYADLFEITWGGWDEERHARHFAASLARGGISLIEVDATRVGMIQLLEEEGDVEVAELQVDPDHQGHGIGTRVLRDVIADANAKSRGVRLKVGLQNADAMRLYERLGFGTVERSDTHCQMRYPAGG